jgi:hypothetical protein
MKPIHAPLLALSFALLSGLAGCGNKETSADASQPLEQSFQAAEPATRQAITTVTTSLKSGNYAEATRALVPIVTAQQLTDSQKEAVAVALNQINQAVAADPTLDTKEMYDLRVKMFRAIRSGPRF